MWYVLVVGLLAALLLRPASTPAFRDADGRPAAGSIAEIEAVEIGGVAQWLHVRGRDATAPVLLFVHGGPGTPETAWLAHYNAALEERFVVVAWEQRGAGKSLRAGRCDPTAMTLEQLVADTVEITDHLKRRFGQQRIYLVGHSWGTLLAIHAAVRRPGDYHALVAVAQTSHAVGEEAAMHEWVLERAHARGHRRAIRELEALAPPRHGRLSLADLSVRLKWVGRFGGGALHRDGGMRELVWVMTRSRLYTPLEKLRYLAGERFSLAHLYDEMAAVDLFTQVPAIEVPIWFVHGRHDHQVPLQVARAYHDALDAPVKHLVVFDDAAHSPLFEDPERFALIMEEVRTNVGAPPRDMKENPR